MNRAACLAFVLAIAVFSPGCGEDRVVSTYVEPPKVLATTVVVPDVSIADNRASQLAEIALPWNQQFEFQGRVLGMSQYNQRIQVATIYLSPRDVPTTTLAVAFLNVEFVGEDVVEYTAVIEPVAQEGKMDIRFTFDSTTLVIPARMDH